MSKKNNLVYGLNDSPNTTKSIMYGFQWLLYSCGMILLVPIIIGSALELNQLEISLLYQRVFFYTGIASLLQVLFGHKLPIIEGPAGLWWGVVTGLASTARAMDMPMEILRASITMGLIIAGILVILIGVTGLIDKLMKYFTPPVTGTVLVLLIMELSSQFVLGALGVGEEGTIDVFATVVSVTVILLIILLTLKGPAFLKSVAVLFGMFFGWAVYAVFGLVDLTPLDNPIIFGLPDLFTWGKPNFDASIVLISVIAGVILIPNVITSILAVSRAGNLDVDTNTFKRGVIFNGVGTLLGGMFSAIGTVSFAASAGLVNITGVVSKLPFIIYSIIMIIIGFIPVIGLALATLPESVGNSVALAAMCTLFSVGIQDYIKLKFTMRDQFVLGLSIMIGVGVMFLPAEAIHQLPNWLGYILGNGLITGMIIVILLEHFIFPDKEHDEVEG